MVHRKSQNFRAPDKSQSGTSTIEKSLASPNDSQAKASSALERYPLTLMTLLPAKAGNRPKSKSLPSMWTSSERRMDLLRLNPLTKNCNSNTVSNYLGVSSIDLSGDIQILCLVLEGPWSSQTWTGRSVSRWRLFSHPLKSIHLARSDHPCPAF